MSKTTGVRTKLFVIAVLTAFSLAGLGGYLVMQMEEVYNAVNYGNVNSVPSLKKLSQVLSDGKAYYGFVIRHVLNTDPAAMGDLEQNLKQELKNVNRGLTDYEKLLSNKTDKQKLAVDNDSWAAVIQVVEEALPISRANRNEEARTILTIKGKPAIEAFQKNLLDHLDYNQKLADASSNKGEASYKSARLIGIVIICIMAIFLSVIILQISRSVIKSMNKSSVNDETVEEGDFTINSKTFIINPETHYQKNIVIKFVLIALLSLSSVVGVGVYLIIQLGEVFTAANYANVNSAPSLNMLSEVVDHNNDYYEYVLRHVLNTDNAVMNQLEQKLTQSLKAVRKGLADYESLLSDYTDKIKLIADQNNLTDVVKAVDEVLILSRENQNDKARDVLTKKTVPALEMFKKVLNDHLQYNMKLADAGNKQGKKVYETTLSNAITIICILSIFLFAAIMLISSSITKPVGKALVTDTAIGKRRVVVIVVPSVLLITGISAYLTLLTDQNIIQVAKGRELQKTATLIQNDIQEQTNKAAARASIVVSLPSIKEAFRKGDSEELEKRLVPAFLLQRSRYGIQVGQFFYPPATAFLDIFNVDKGKGEDRSSFRDMVVKASRDQEAQKGIEIGRGGLSVRGVDLVRDAEGFIGSFEVGLSFATILENIKRNSGFDASVFVDDELMSRVATFLPRPDAEQIVGGFRNVESTNWNIMKLLVAPDIITYVEDVTMHMKKVNGMDYGIIIVPLLDYNGSQIGTVVATRNFEEYQTQMTAALVRSIALSLFQALVLSGIMIVLINSMFVRPAEVKEAK